MSNPLYLILLAISTISIFALQKFIRKSKGNSQLTQVFNINFILIIVWNLSLILQILFSNINPIFFDYIAYIAIVYIPISFLFTSIVFVNTKIKFKKLHLLLFVIPLISLIILWTNNLHHLFYVNYSTQFRNATFGPYFIVHTIYSYTCIAIGIFYLLFYTIKNSGFFSKQSLVISIGTLLSLFINIVATFGILDLSIYITPVSFTIFFIFIAISMFKFNFLSVAPIALQKIVDRISDAYVVVNEDSTITDFNETFLKLFKVNANQIRNQSLDFLFEEYKYFGIDSKLIQDSINQTKTNNDTILLEEYLQSINKYFHIEITSIKPKGNFLGTIILLKDITQHTIDMQTIKNNQDMLVEKERLASLGQMIGGIAHNLKTPIMSISGATEGLSDLIKEYEESISDPEVTIKDHHEIAGDMKEWIDKIKTHLSYMSDVITAIKGQAVAFSEQTSNGFTVKELINYIDILMKHELKNALINLKIQANIDTSTSVKGNINSLVQVINNIISNAIQAYQLQGKTNQDINFTVYREDNNLIFKIEDFADGLPDNVQEKLFKEMITTKGKNGTGLGLFMSYSNIKAHFNGNLRYTTQKGKGTSFFVEIPLL